MGYKNSWRVFLFFSLPFIFFFFSFIIFFLFSLISDAANGAFGGRLFAVLRLQYLSIRSVPSSWWLRYRQWSKQFEINPDQAGGLLAAPSLFADNYYPKDNNNYVDKRDNNDYGELSEPELYRWYHRALRVTIVAKLFPWKFTGLSYEPLLRTEESPKRTVLSDQSWTTYEQTTDQKRKESRPSCNTSRIQVKTLSSMDLFK